MTSKLDQLREMTVVVADTGDIDAINLYQPIDATTNPSLILKAAELERYRPLLEQSVNRARQSHSDWLPECMDTLAVGIGREILQVIPGRVSTEIDARLSFDTEATIARGMNLVEKYQNAGIASDRILLKIAATWEGIRAAEQLEKAGIQCNLTLIFSFEQAAAAADAGAFLISPFVGRILDWHKRHSGKTDYLPEEDPGVLSVKSIYNFYKQYGYDTIVMGASFRNTDQIEALAGCDRLTISPQLLEALNNDGGHLVRQLHPDNAGEAINYDQTNEASFRYQLNNNAMATEKLAEGIRNFIADQDKLEIRLMGETAR
ncbi:transaldolase [uncultured Porticoccus sp.]|uniref:transaldolase n=1 Tax=uncultured Porticoccus sp. TaxID=1256050 RepID=UPI0030DACF0E|tara:strand:+ start:1036 stop:1989 length:954 start_codon:yes stop_codon:yes gene_type:complete